MTSNHKSILYRIIIYNIVLLLFMGNWTWAMQYNIEQHPFRASLSATTIFPTGELADLLKPGYGVSFSVSRNLGLLDDLYAGCYTGYWYFPGKHEDVTSAYFIPLMIPFTYTMTFFSWFDVSPTVYLGGIYSNITYVNHNDTAYHNGVPTGSVYSAPVREDALQGSCMYGVDFSWAITHFDYLVYGIRHGILFEEDGPLHFFLIQLGYMSRY